MNMKRPELTQFQRHLHYSSWRLFEEKKVREIFGDCIEDISKQITSRLSDESDVIDLDDISDDETTYDTMDGSEVNLKKRFVLL